jgi:hypothetical protein
MKIPPLLAAAVGDKSPPPSLPRQLQVGYTNHVSGEKIKIMLIHCVLSTKKNIEVKMLRVFTLQDMWVSTPHPWFPFQRIMPVDQAVSYTVQPLHNRRGCEMALF